uniref:Glutamate--cysteine ligase n=1 Tax=Meloidogyne hapla TaxID=6305 RepID=A0A1I8B8Q6_MELHA
MLNNKLYIINRWNEAKYNLAFFDINNIEALYYFHAAEIKNVFAINNTKILAYQFDYAGKDYPKNMKDFYETWFHDSEQNIQNEDYMYPSLQIYKNQLEKFEKFHKKLDEMFIKDLKKNSIKYNSFKWLNKILNNEEEGQIQTIKSLYSQIKAIFINSDEVIEVPLGSSKPDNLFYVCGFHMNNEQLKNNLVNLYEMNLS